MTHTRGEPMWYLFDYGMVIAVRQISRLEDLDAAQWSHLNADTVSVLETLRGAGGKLAVSPICLPACRAGTDTLLLEDVQRWTGFGD